MNFLLLVLLVTETVYCHRASYQYWPRQYSPATQNQKYYLPSNIHNTNNRNRHAPQAQNIKVLINNKIRWKKNAINSAVQWKKNFLHEKTRIISNLIQPKLRFKQDLLRAKYDLKRNIWNAKRRLVIKPLLDIKRKKLGFLKGLVDHKINFLKSLFG